MDWFWLYTVQGQQLQLAWDGVGYLVDTEGGQYIVDSYGLITTTAGEYIGSLQDAAESIRDAVPGLVDRAEDAVEEAWDDLIFAGTATAFFAVLIGGGIIWYLLK